MLDENAGVGEAQAVAIRIANQLEATESESKVAQVQPHGSHVNAHSPKDPEGVDRREAIRDMPAAAREVLRHADLRPRVSRLDPIQKARQDPRGSVKMFVGDPGVLVELRIPVASRSLQNGFDLG